MLLTVCSYHVTYAFQSESTLYNWLNVKEILARNRHKICSVSDCNGTRTDNHLVRKRGFESRCSHVYMSNLKVTKSFEMRLDPKAHPDPPHRTENISFLCVTCYPTIPTSPYRNHNINNKNNI